MSASGSTPVIPIGVYVRVWLGLLLIVAVEVLLAYYAHVGTGALVAMLLALALLEAGIGVWYFMHVKYERRILLWSLVLLLAIIFMMNQVWPDAFRLHSLHH